MALNPISQPALFLDSVPAVSQRGDLMAVEYPGLTLMMTPHALLAIVGKGKAAMNDWAAIEAAKIAGHVVDDKADVIAFPKACPIIRCAGEAC